MRKAVGALALLAVVALLPSPDARACGDKFLVIGRGMRHYRAAHPATILIYMRPGSGLVAAAHDLRLESSLKQAGHKTETVEDPAVFRAALRTGRFDLVLADLADAPAASDEARSEAPRTTVVPVLYKPARADLPAVEGRYGYYLKAPSRSEALLATIDDAMELRGKTARNEP